jgi:exodeoxyribonuclease-3
MTKKNKIPEKIALTTWNINSVRLRMPLVKQFVEARAPDILCLQETKVRDAEFPFSALRDMGFAHIEIHGQKGYHGVAVASRIPLSAPQRRNFCDKGDARHLGVSFQLGERKVDLHNLYVPAGGDEPDRALNEKFGHKLDFLDEMAAWSKAERHGARDTILVGDLNVAPLEQDVWSHKALLKVVSHTPIEVEKMNAAIAHGQWVDVMRKFVAPTEKLYSWWSYRSPDWEKADKGRRLDHIWASPSLAARALTMDVMKEARGWERPSDHAPVTTLLSGA